MERYLREVLGEIRFEDLKVPLAVMATEFRTARSVVMREGPVAWALSASASIPVVFSPVMDGSRVLVDGGLTDNLPRVLPAGSCAQIRLGSWEIPEVFTLIQEHGGVSDEEMFRVFNMGFGYVLFVRPDDVSATRQSLEAAGEEVFPVGQVVTGQGEVNLQKARYVLDKTGVDAVMIGRAAQGRPWLFRQIREYLDTGTAVFPTLEQRRDTLLKHLQNLYDFYGTYTGVRVARKHISWYAKSNEGGAQLWDSVKQVEDRDLQFRMVSGFFSRHPL